MNKLKFTLYIFVSLTNIFLFAQNRCVVKVEGKYGYIDTLGHIVIPIIYDSGLQFSEGLAAVKCNEKWGYIDTNGIFVIQPIFQGTESFKEGCAIVWIKDDSISKSGVINKRGRWIIKPKYKIISHQNEGFVSVVENEKMAYFDLTKRKFITKFIYDNDESWCFSEGLAMVKIGKFYGFINRIGKIVIEPKYGQVGRMQFSNGLASVRDEKSGLWGYINRKGKKVIDFKYNEADEFKEKIAWVQNTHGSLRYAIDTLGNRLFELNVNYAWGFKNGLCGVTIDKKHGVIDSYGKWVVEPIYDWLHVFYSDGWIAFFNRIDDQAKWGILNINGKEILPAMYSNIVKNDGDCILPEIYVGDCQNDVNNCKRGYANLRGEIIWQPTD